MDAENVARSDALRAADALLVEFELPRTAGKTDLLLAVVALAWLHGWRAGTEFSVATLNSIAEQHLGTNAEGVTKG